MTAPPPPLESDFDLAAIAAREERRNLSVQLLLMGLVFAIVGALFAGVTRARATAAARQVASARANTKRVERIASAIDELKEASDQPWANTYEEIPLIRSALIALADKAHVTPKPGWGDPRNDTLEDSPLTRQIIEARLNGADLEPFLQWITQAQQEIPGLEVVALDMTPAEKGWTIRCRLGRWEIRQ